MRKIELFLLKWDTHGVGNASTKRTRVLLCRVGAGGDDGDDSHDPGDSDTKFTSSDQTSLEEVEAGTDAGLVLLGQLTHAQKANVCVCVCRALIDR